MTMGASQAAASIAMPQRQSRIGELSEFQKVITLGMNIKDTSNREIGRRIEMDRNEATVLVRAFLRDVRRGSIENLGRPTRLMKLLIIGG